MSPPLRRGVASRSAVAYSFSAAASRDSSAELDARDGATTDLELHADELEEVAIGADAVRAAVRTLGLDIALVVEVAASLFAAELQPRVHPDHLAVLPLAAKHVLEAARIVRHDPPVESKPELRCVVVTAVSDDLSVAEARRSSRPRRVAADLVEQRGERARVGRRGALREERAR